MSTPTCPECGKPGWQHGLDYECYDCKTRFRGRDESRFSDALADNLTAAARRSQQHVRPADQGSGAAAATSASPYAGSAAAASTDVTAEVHGLDQSIGYAQTLAAFAGEHGQAGNEGYIAHLTGQKVAGDALRTAAEMQEAFTVAQTAAEAHAAELEKQKTVQEAYDANPDAGDKDYQLMGR